jgi:hypothetical protein
MARYHRFPIRNEGLILGTVLRVVPSIVKNLVNKWARRLKASQIAPKKAQKLFLTRSSFLVCIYEIAAFNIATGRYRGTGVLRECLLSGAKASLRHQPSIADVPVALCYGKIRLDFDAVLLSRDETQGTTGL